MIFYNKDISKIIENSNKILIAGNTCSGKSTLIEELKESEYPVIRNKKNFQDFIKSSSKFSTIILSDPEDINIKLSNLGIKRNNGVGIIYAHPDFSYTII